MGSGEWGSGELGKRSYSPLPIPYSLLPFQIVVQIKPFDPVDGAPTVEAVDHAGPRDATDLFAEAFVAQQPRQGDGQRMRVIAFEEQAGDAVLNYLGHSADAGRDDSAAGGHGFDQGEREGLVVRRRGDDVEGGEQRGQVFNIAGESQMVADAQSIGRLPQLVEVRFVFGGGLAHYQEFGVAPVTVADQARGGFDEQVLAFQPCDLADETDGQTPFDAEPGARLLAAQISAAAGVDPVRDGDDAVGEIGEGFDETLAHAVRDGDQRARLADRPGVKRIRFDRVKMMARDEESDRVSKPGDDPRGDAAKRVIARQMGV